VVLFGWNRGLTPIQKVSNFQNEMQVKVVIVVDVNREKWAMQPRDSVNHYEEVFLQNY
jgi:hypothetical protein